MSVESAMSRLVARLDPQPGPRHTYAAECTVIENLLAVTLPPDYKEYVRLLPAGAYWTWFVVLHPGWFDSADGMSMLIRTSGRYWQSNRDHDPSFPYDFYPREGGLLPWALVEDEFMVCWDQSGPDPGGWTTVVVNDDLTAWRTFDLTMVEFLLLVLDRGTDVFGAALDAAGPPFAPFEVQRQWPVEEPATDNDLHPAGYGIADLRRFLI